MGPSPTPSAAPAPAHRARHVPGGGPLVSGSSGGAAPRSAPAAPGGGPGRGRHRRGGLRPRWRRRAASPRLASPHTASPVRSSPRRGGAASPHAPASSPGRARGAPRCPPAGRDAALAEPPPSPRGSCWGCGWHHGHRAPGRGGRAPCALRLSREGDASAPGGNILETARSGARRTSGTAFHRLRGGGLPAVASRQVSAASPPPYPCLE